MSKSLTNHLHLKKELFQLRIDEGTDVRDHLNVFNKLITQLASVSVKVDNEDKALLLLTSLPQSYKSLVTALIIGKETLKVKEVTIVILDDKKFKNTGSSNEGGAFVAGSSHGKSKSHGNN